MTQQQRSGRNDTPRKQAHISLPDSRVARRPNPVISQTSLPRHAGPAEPHLPPPTTRREIKFTWGGGGGAFGDTRCDPGTSTGLCVWFAPHSNAHVACCILPRTRTTTVPRCLSMYNHRQVTGRLHARPLNSPNPQSMRGPSHYTCVTHLV